MNAQQIKNFRRVLVQMHGIAAHYLTDNEVVDLRNKMQTQLDKGEIPKGLLNDK